MANWIYVGGLGLLTVLLAWAVLRRRECTFNLEPLSQHWLAERKRIADIE